MGTIRLQNGDWNDGHTAGSAGVMSVIIMDGIPLFCLPGILTNSIGGRAKRWRSYTLGKCVIFVYQAYWRTLQGQVLIHIPMSLIDTDWPDVLVFALNIYAAFICPVLHHLGKHHSKNLAVIEVIAPYKEGDRDQSLPSTQNGNNVTDLSISHEIDLSHWDLFAS